MPHKLPALLAVAATLTLAACGGSGDSASSTDSHVSPKPAAAGGSSADGGGGGGGGSADAGSSADSPVSVKAAEAGVERAARVDLVSQPVPDEAADQGLRASYSNAGTVAKDRQAVALFVLDDADAAEQVKELVGRPTAGSRLIVHDELLVVYAAAGKDRGEQVEKAVNAL